MQDSNKCIRQQELCKMHLRFSQMDGHISAGTVLAIHQEFGLG